MKVSFLRPKYNVVTFITVRLFSNINDQIVNVFFLYSSASYPSQSPEIIIRSESITKDNISDLEQFLKCKSETLLGQDMIQTLTTEAKEKFKDLGLRPGKASVVDSHTYIGKKGGKNKKSKKRNPKSEDEIVENEKLPPMKTSDDVVKRIIWDDNLDKDEFIVGYIDRFRGLVEKYFSAFSWEDLASVDYDVLAVPKHRIQYFSYKGVKVWDKPRRIDNVFGSASGTKTIDVVMKEIQEAERQGQAGAGERETTKEDDSYSDSDSDFDDGIVVNIGSGCGVGLSKHGSAAAKGEDEMDVSETKEEDSYWQDKLRPNYFTCVRITNEKIIDEIGNIQDDLMQQEPLFAECCIPGASLHVTLSCLGLDTAEQLSECIKALQKFKPEIEAALPKSVLKLRGVSNFYNRVIYGKVECEKDFLDFQVYLKELLSQAGISVRDGYEFVPHCTIMKTTRPVSRLRGTKNVDTKVYEKFLDTEFGEQTIDSIYLCSMGKERREDGFYLTPAELHFKS